MIDFNHTRRPPGEKKDYLTLDSIDLCRCVIKRNETEENVLYLGGVGGASLSVC
jgi:hypothetical protein